MVTTYNRGRPRTRGKESGELNESKRGAEFFLRRIALVYGVIKRTLPFVCLFLSAVGGEAQVQVDLKFKRLQYIAYEHVMATLGVTNLAGRDLDVHDADGQSWVGVEERGGDSQPIQPIATDSTEQAFHIMPAQTEAERINCRCCIARRPAVGRIRASA